jgi:hypothetical protein
MARRPWTGHQPYNARDGRKVNRPIPRFSSGISLIWAGWRASGCGFVSRNAAITVGQLTRYGRGGILAWEHVFLQCRFKETY